MSYMDFSFLNGIFIASIFFMEDTNANFFLNSSYGHFNDGDVGESSIEHL